MSPFSMIMFSRSYRIGPWKSDASACSEVFHIYFEQKYHRHKHHLITELEINMHTYHIMNMALQTQLGSATDLSPTSQQMK